MFVNVVDSTTCELAQRCFCSKGPEYSGNCVSSNGELTLYTANPGEPMEIDFEVARGKEEQIYQ